MVDPSAIGMAGAIAKILTDEDKLQILQENEECRKSLYLHLKELSPHLELISTSLKQPKKLAQQKEGCIYMHSKNAVSKISRRDGQLKTEVSKHFRSLRAFLKSELTRFVPESA